MPRIVASNNITLLPHTLYISIFNIQNVQKQDITTEWIEMLITNSSECFILLLGCNVYLVIVH